MAVSKPVPDVTDARVRPAQPGVIGLLGKIRGASWGGLLGLAATGALSLALPTVHEKPWLELPLGMLCVAGGLLLERAVGYFVGRKLDSWLQHRAARYEADLELAKLREYRRRGTLGQHEFQKLSARAARQDVVGGGRVGVPRGPYKKKGSVDPPRGEGT